MKCIHLFLGQMKFELCEELKLGHKDVWFLQSGSGDRVVSRIVAFLGCVEKTFTNLNDQLTIQQRFTIIQFILHFEQFVITQINLHESLLW